METRVPDLEGRARTKSESEEIEALKTAAYKQGVRRGAFANVCEYTFSVIGFAVGLGNVWRFPYVTYENGGGAFFLSYLIMILFCGLPSLVAEIGIGQYSGLNGNIIFRRLCPLFRGLGWTMFAAAFINMFNYCMILGWAVRFMFAVFHTDLPWSKCGLPELGVHYNTKNCFEAGQFEACRLQENHTKTFWDNTCTEANSFCTLNKNICKEKKSKCTRELMGYFNRTHCENRTATSLDNKYVRYEDAIFYNSPSQEYWIEKVLGLGESRTWEQYGFPRWDLVLSLAFVWVVTFAGSAFGPKSVGKVMYITGTLPFVILGAMLISTLTLPGAGTGVLFYLKPEPSKLLHLAAWNIAGSQLFYSLSLGKSGIITMSSYNRFHSNVIQNAIIVTVVDTFVSVLSGFVVFSSLGFLAETIRKPLTKVVQSGISLAFVVYPQATIKMPVPQFWAFLFYLLLLLVGLNSTFSYLDLFSSYVVDAFPFLLKYKVLLTATFAFLGFLGGISMTCEAGFYMFKIIDTAATQILLLLGLTELCIIVYIYGYRRFEANLVEMIGDFNIVFKWYLRVTLCFFTPLILLLMLVWTMIGLEKPGYGSYKFPAPYVALMWLIYAFFCLPTIVFAIYETIDTVFIKKKSWKTLFRTTEDWAPASDLLEKEMAMSAGKPDAKLTTLLDEKLLKEVRQNRAKDQAISGKGGSLAETSAEVEREA